MRGRIAALVNEIVREVDAAVQLSVHDVMELIGAPPITLNPKP